ncbi:unnamed protein product [Rhizoctonia solani]|uniref:Transmembrane protein n=1 Tax=Rhizoctonia solani TaxID=456999 RepID=A0A8H3BD24_9AGAM|nr:unnamed protein product [Rhizoctonia solani]
MTNYKLALDFSPPPVQEANPPRLNWIYLPTRMSRVIGTVIDDADTSAIGFQYFGSWGTGERIQQHYAGTSSYSDTPFSRALLFFRGKSITYFADRGNLSFAAVSIDGQSEDTVNLTSSVPLFQQQVWSKNLTDDDHQLVIRHAGAPRTEIMMDFVSFLSGGGTISTSAGPAASSVTSTALILNCTDPVMMYSPNWRSVEDGMFYAGRSMLTQSPGASVQFTFNGTAIWYFTDTNSDHAKLRIRVDDDRHSEVVQGYSPTPLAQRLVWSKTDLPAGTHTINITHEDTDGKYATLDFFRYVPSAGTEPHPKKGGLTTGAIVGIVIAGLFLLGILYCAAIRWAIPHSRNDDESDPPPSYRPANSISRSSEDTSQRPDFVTAPQMTHLGEPRIMPSPATFTTGQASPQLAESVLSTPAQRYRDSARFLLGGNRTSQVSSVGTSPRLRSASTPELHAILPSNPPSYQGHT